MLQDIGDLLGVSHERVRQLESLALSKLFRRMEFEDMKKESMLELLRKKVLSVGKTA